MFTLVACKDSSDAKTQESVEAPVVATDAVQTNTKTPEPAQNAAGVWHYTCSKGCAGGSGTASACSVCGGTLAHNAAYHGNANNPTNPTTAPIITPQSTPPAAEPAQNANGVWHYICGNGCAGGGNKADVCGKCGGALTHNSAYH